MTDECMDSLSGPIDDQSDPGSWARERKLTECMRTNGVDLDWPPKKLSPNGSQGDYRGKAKVKAGYRRDCMILARAARLKLPDSKEIPINVEYFPPDRRRRDWDNCVAMSKGLFDGVADALGIDDSRFVPTIKLHEFNENIKGIVRVTI